MDYKNDIEFRRETLKKLLFNIHQKEELITKALYDDFKKPPFETTLSEISYVVKELNLAIKNIRSWVKPERIRPSILNFPSSDYIYKEPYGKVLIIAPWNYPFHLAIVPLIAAVAAGNQVVLKPSHLTKNTSKIIAALIKQTFHINHVEVVEGEIEATQKLLSKRWDYIFFTGSVSVGKIVAKAAAEYLTPITLELGGKNPCIVDETANLKLAAKRIVWGKFINAGQTCVAPDYIIVHEQMKNHLIGFLKEEITKAYGRNVQESPDYARIIDVKNWIRLVELIDYEKVLFGGQTNSEDNYIAPTLIAENNTNSAIMKDEIFGPMLPILTYKTEEDIEKIVNQYEKPLALYIFSDSKNFIEKYIQKFSFGGGSVNDTMVHLVNNRLPFGGVGHSGIGAYHGKLSFNLFTHQKAITKRGTWLDFPLRYAPYKDKISILKRFIHWL